MYGQRSADGRWWWDGYQWQPVPTVPEGPPPKGRWGRKEWLLLGGLVGVLVLGLTVSAIASPGSGPTPQDSPPSASVAAPRPTVAPTTVAETPQPTKPPTPPPPPKVLAEAQGNASGETAPFDSDGHFKVAYHFDCSSFGASGNFIVTPTDANGNDLAGPEVNRLAANGDGTADGYTFGHQNGMHLQIISECSWHVTVTTA
jgi:hypothetical protein